MTSGIVLGYNASYGGGVHGSWGVEEGGGREGGREIEGEIWDLSGPEERQNNGTNEEQGCLGVDRETSVLGDKDRSPYQWAALCRAQRRPRGEEGGGGRQGMLSSERVCFPADENPLKTLSGMDLLWITLLWRHTLQQYREKKSCWGFFFFLTVTRTRLCGIMTVCLGVSIFLL